MVTGVNLGKNSGNSEEKLRDLGERRAIEIITALLSKDNENIAIGPGDDCAAIELGEDYLLITTDMAVSKTHFPPGITPYQMGWFIVAINLSDLAAKGAEPLGVVVATGMPDDMDSIFLKDLISGMNSCATQFRTSIIGGDLKVHDQLTLTGTAFGKVRKTEFMPRRGARPADLVAVTGKLGGAGAAYYVIKNDLSVDDSILKGLFEPVPRIQEGRVLAKTGAVTSSMDISDGLADSLYQLAAINCVGFEIDFDKIPTSPGAQEIAKELDIPMEEFAVYFGGDYELLITLDPSNWEQVKNDLQNINGSISVIGRVTSETDLILIKENEKIQLENRGYEHFKWKA
jgi:thiamine-monophosphate kinase